MMNKHSKTNRLNLSVILLLGVVSSSCYQPSGTLNPNKNVGVGLKTTSTDLDNSFDEQIFRIVYPDKSNPVGYYLSHQNDGLLTSSSYRNMKALANTAIQNGFNKEAYLLYFNNTLEHYITTVPIVDNLNDSGYILKRTEVFNAFKDGYNEDSYLLAFPDIMSAVRSGALRSGLQHYLLSGKNEGRLNLDAYKNVSKALKKAMSEGFNETAYMYSFPDVLDTINNGYLQNGQRYYIINGLQHYLMFGKDEGRINSRPYQYVYADFRNAINQSFNETAYMIVNQDVYNSDWVSGLQHFVLVGKNEGRLDLPEYINKKNEIINAQKSGYDEETYLIAFPSVGLSVKCERLRKNGLTLPSDCDGISLLKYGIQDYLLPGNQNKLTEISYTNAKIAVQQAYSDGFNEQAYQIAFSDVRGWLLNGTYGSGLEHYLGTSPYLLTDSTYQTTKNHIIESYAKGFIESAYLTAYPDIAISVKNKTMYSGLYHYINYGWNENRLQNPEYLRVKTALNPPKIISGKAGAE